MANIKRLNTGYWREYAVPETPGRCFAPRTLVAAFGPEAELEVRHEAALGLRGWIYVVVVGVTCVALCAAALVAHARALT